MSLGLTLWQQREREFKKFMQESQEKIYPDPDSMLQRQSKRMNAGKAPLSFLLDFPKAVEAFARVKELGAAKYERDNWKLGNKPDEEYLDACLRHLVAYKAGEEFANDSGCHHIAHAAWNLFALLELNIAAPYDPELFRSMIAKWENDKK